MKMKQKYILVFLLSFPLATLGLTANAQTRPLPAKSLEQVLAAADTSTNLETLSGIHLKPAKKGSFKLDFSQILKENATLAITNTAGKLIYQKPVNVAKNQNSWSYNLGKLKPDIYLVEVKTSDTTYWTKFKIGK